MILKESKNWFFFRFEDSDYRKYGAGRINTFLAEMRKNIPAEERHFYAEDNEWQLPETQRREFNRLMQKHLLKNQLNLF